MSRVLTTDGSPAQVAGAREGPQHGCDNLGLLLSARNIRKASIPHLGQIVRAVEVGAEDDFHTAQQDQQF